MITNLRLAGNVPGIPGPVSAWWRDITALTTDPDAGTLTLTTGNRWYGIFYGPGTAAIAVAAIAVRAGPQALVGWPACGWLPAPTAATAQ